METDIELDSVVEVAAQAAHEANRAYCQALGDETQVPWEAAPEWQKTSARSGARGVLAGNTPEQSHASWVEEKRAAGWKYGATKDPERKEHPCFVPYAELPPAQRAKDDIFCAVVIAVAGAFGWAPPQAPPKQEGCGWCGQRWVRKIEASGGTYFACTLHEYLLPPGAETKRPVKMVPTARIGETQ